MTRARQVANFDPALFAADEVSGDKVSGGTIGAGTIGGSTIVNTSGAITTTGAFTSVGIDDNASGAVAITIDSDERVGIGSTSMSSLSASGNQLVVGDGSGSKGITIHTGSGGSDYGSIYFTDTTSEDRGQIRYSGGDAMGFYTGGGLVMTATLGKVGIGTSSPSNLLHIAGGDSSNDNYRTSADTPVIIEAGASENSWIQFIVDSSSYWSGILMCDDGTDTAEFGYMAGDGQCIIKSNGLNCFSIDSTRLYQLRGYNKYAGYGRPDANNSYDWGTSGDRWKDVWCNQGAFNDSDINLKKDIAPSALGLDFINKLNPVSYKWKDIPEVLWKEDDEDFKTMVHAKGIKVGDVRVPAKTHKRTHYGLVAQEVVSTLDELGIDTVDFAAYADGKASLDSDGNKIGEDGACALRYTEFISPMIKAIQELSAKVTALENA